MSLPLLVVVRVVVTVVLALLTVAALLVLLLVLLLMAAFLELVLSFATHEGAGKSTDDAVTGLVSKQTTAESAGYRTHKTAIALLACSWVGGAILVMLLSCVRVVGILRWGVLVVGSLLRELVRWVALRVLTAVRLSAHYLIYHITETQDPLLCLVLRRGRSTVLRLAILAVLESTVGWSTILLVVLVVAILVVAVLRWRRSLLVTALLVASISLLWGLVAVLALVLVLISVRV